MRRHVPAALAASLTAALEGAPVSGNQFIEVRRYQLRNSHENQVERTSAYLAAIAPALERAGVKPAGFFQGVIGPENPSIVAVLPFADLAAAETARKSLVADRAVVAAMETVHNGPGAPWQRIETYVLRAFDGFPAVQAAEPKPGRIFELRMYESQDEVTLARKVRMFNDGEIGIFQRLGMMPVFFGQTVTGPKMPNLIYMLSFDSMAARDRLWSEFGSDPAWKKMSSEPMLKDAEVVTNISNEIVRPLAFSAIR